jgi:hypothetical protein
MEPFPLAAWLEHVLLSPDFWLIIGGAGAGKTGPDFAAADPAFLRSVIKKAAQKAIRSAATIRDHL